MSKHLMNGTQVEIPEKNGVYTIKSVLGAGSSTVAYLAEYTDINNHVQSSILKEYCPNYINFKRTNDGVIIVSDQDQERYKKGLRQFKNGCSRQLEVREYEVIRNNTPPANGPYEINNTLYFVVARYSGRTLEQCVDDLNLVQRIKVVISLSKVIAAYHACGYLCLDIKPENVFVFPETEELIQVIDFDSIVKKNALQFGCSTSYTERWAAPEQRNPYAAVQIDERTDVFILGEILFWLIFGRNSMSSEHRMFSEYCFSEVACQYPEFDRRSVQQLLSKILRRTIRSSANNRFNRVADLIPALEELLSEVAQPVYVKDSIIPGTAFFVGREKEISRIKLLIEQNQCVFISGMPGIGKTEVVKRFWSISKEKYKSCMWVPYKTTLEDSLADDVALTIVGVQRYQDESDMQYSVRKIERLRKLATNQDLMVIDNANNLSFLQSALWRELQGTQAKIVVITRLPVTEYECVQILPFEDIESLRTIYGQYVPFEKEELQVVDELIRRVGFHTQLVELLAKQTHATYSSPSKMLKLLQANGISFTDKSELKVLKDNNIVVAAISRHIAALFSVNEFSDKQKNLMLSAIMMPTTGVPIADFKSFWGITDMTDIAWLEERGWIQIVKDKEYYVSVHPAIAVSVLEQIKAYHEFDYVRFALGLLSIMRKGYDEDSVREEHWAEFKGSYKNALEKHGVPEDRVYVILESARESELTRSEIAYKEYVRLCDSIADNMIYYALSDRYAFYFVKEYCKLFRKYGNAKHKLAILEWYHANSENAQCVDDDIYTDLLIDIGRSHDAISLCQKNIQYYANDSANQLVWRIRLSAAALQAKDLKGYLVESISSEFIVWMLSKKVNKCPPEDQPEISRVIKEAYPRLAELYEARAKGIIIGRNWKHQAQYRDKKKWYNRAIKYRKLAGRKANECSSDNYLMIAIDEAIIQIMSENDAGAKAILEGVLATYQHKGYADISAIYLVYELLSESLLNLSEWEEAEKYAQLALETAKQLILQNTCGARFDLGVAYHGMQCYEEAEEVLMQLTDELQTTKSDNYSDCGEAYMYLADISEKKNDPIGAIERYKQAQQCYSNLHSWKQLAQCACYDKIADLLFEQKDYEGAVENLQKAVDLFAQKRKNGVRVPKQFKDKLKRYKTYS